MGLAVLSGSTKRVAESLSVLQSLWFRSGVFRSQLLSGMRGTNRSGLAWDDGRGFVNTGARLYLLMVAARHWTIDPSGFVERCRIEPDPFSERIRADWSTTALGWLEPIRHRSGLVRRAGLDHAAIGMCLHLLVVALRHCRPLIPRDRWKALSEQS